MSFSRILLAAATASLLATAAFAADPTPSAPTMQAGGGHGVMRGMLSPEERMMWMADAFKATAGMTEDQRHAYRQQQREHFMAMSDGDRAKFKADLYKRWASLPADQKAAIQTKMDAFIASHQRPTAQ
jgi:hypothetical protein